MNKKNLNERTDGYIDKINKKTKIPYFYLREYFSNKLFFFVWTIFTLIISTIFVLLVLLIFLPNFSLLKYISFTVQKNYWPILIPISPLYLILIINWFSSLLKYSGFKKEYKSYKKQKLFPDKPTQFIKFRYIGILGSLNSLAWLAAAIYITLILSLIVLYVYVFWINGWNHGQSETVNNSLQLIIVEKNNDLNYSLRFYAVIIGIISASYFVCHILFRFRLKQRALQIENYYNGPDQIVDGAYLTQKLKRINRRNLILFSCYLFFIFIFLYLAIKISKKLFPKFNLFSKLFRL